MEKVLYKVPIGILEITADDKFLYQVYLLENAGLLEDNIIKSKEDIQNKIISDTINQLDEYFEGKRKIFDLPLKLSGTDFQQKVWTELSNIPYGQLRTYKEIAKNIDCPKAARAIGNANCANPFIIIIPCHRVIKSDGSIGGYMGSKEESINIKRTLLRLESIKPF